MTTPDPDPAQQPDALPEQQPDAQPDLHLAIDIGPLHGHRTGVGVAVDGLIGALRDRDDVRLDPYLVSFRADRIDGQRKLPLPGIIASHLWSRLDRPSADRWLESVDVVHGTNYVAPPSSRPTVVSVYDCWAMTNPHAAGALVRRASANLRRRVAAGAWVHASSEATAIRARELLNTDRVVAIHLGPPPPPADTGAADREVTASLEGASYVLAIGTEERRKDLTTLVAAFAILAEQMPDLRLVLAGARGDQSGLVDAALAGLADDTRNRTHRVGVVDDATKAWLLRHAAVLAYPSLDEGFGFPLLEAQDAGTPVVASDVGAIAEIAGAGVALVGDRSAAAFAERLGSVVDGTTSRLGLISAGHENLARFSWSSTAAQLTALYRQAADAR
jgi:glycosyltransferase involved in cell wall biosynthesis